MNKKFFLAVLAYMLPAFPLGCFRHLNVFAGYYRSLQVNREDVIVPFGMLAMLAQGVIFAVIYRGMLSGQPVGRGALKFGALAAPLS